MMLILNMLIVAAILAFLYVVYCEGVEHGL